MDKIFTLKQVFKEAREKKQRLFVLFMRLLCVRNMGGDELREKDAWRRFKRCIYQNKKETNEQFGKKMN